MQLQYVKIIAKTCGGFGTLIIYIELSVFDSAIYGLKPKWRKVACAWSSKLLCTHPPTPPLRTGRKGVLSKSLQWSLLQ